MQLKRKSFTQLCLADRIQIEIRYCRDFWELNDIAKEFKRPVSTIHREIGNSPRKGNNKYNAYRKNDAAYARRHTRGRKGKLSYEPLRTYVLSKLTASKKERWSPEIIAVRIKLEYPDDAKMRVSYEAIYEYIYAQIDAKYGKVKKGCVDYRMYLHRRHRRREKRGVRRANKEREFNEKPSIHARPAAVDAREEIGHFEDDLIVSRESLACLKTVTERSTRIHLIELIADKTIASGDVAVRKRLAFFPSEFRKTLTRDRGTENMGWEALSEDLAMNVYFADPYRSCQRGTNENANGMTRRHFPKKTNFELVSSQEIMEVEYAINTRPRPILGGYTPCKVLYMKTGIVLYPDRPESIALIS